MNVNTIRSWENLDVSYLSAFDAAGCELIFVASGTVNVLFTRNKRFRSNRRLTDAAAEAFFVPLASFIFHLFRA